MSVHSQNAYHQRSCPAFAVVALSLALTLTYGCHSGHQKKTIAVIAKSSGSDIWRQLRAGIQSQANAAHEIVQWAAPESEADYTQQADMVDDAIRRHVDGILLSPSHQMVLASSVRRAHEAGIPLVIVDAPIALPSDHYVAYVGSSDVEIGSLAADRAAQVLHGKGRVGILGVSPTLEGSTLREQAFRDRLHQQSPNIQIVATAYGTSDWTRSAEAARDMLMQHPGVNLIFASDPFGTAGAATEVQNRKNAPLLIGVDNEFARLAAVDRGEIDSLIVEDMQRIGRDAVTALNGSPRIHYSQGVIEVPVTLHTRPAELTNRVHGQSGERTAR